MTATIITGDVLGPDEMRTLFNEGFSGYLVPMHLDAAAFETHLERNDIALGSSPVLVDGRPLAFALVGIRGPHAWIGGMGTIPAARRGGHATRVLEAAIAAARARGCAELSLEVIDANLPALGLYERLGFRTTRDLLVWTLPASAPTGGAVDELDVDRAAAWIAAHRTAPEPWQRADRVLARLARGGVALCAVGVREQDELVGAAIGSVDGDVVSLLQIAAPDESVAARLLGGAAGGRGLRLANAPAEDPASRVMARLGGELVARQHEMRLAL